MAITYPDCYTPFVEKEFDLNEPVSEEIIRKLVQNSNMLTKLCPVGSLRLFATNVPGVASPDSTFFQRADGSVVTDGNSPFLGVNTPNFDGKYIISAITTNSNSQVGVVENKLKHTHGNVVPIAQDIYRGTTGTTCIDIGLEGGSGGGDTSYQCHNHFITFDLDITIPVQPQYYTLGLYMKIT